MPSHISPADVDHIAHLSRLKLSSEEIRLFGDQLSSILDYIEKLNEVNTDGVEPTAHALPVCNVFRPDEPRPSLGSERVLANAPGKDGSFFSVPKVLDQESA